MEKLTLLGDITPSRFLKEYWHKKPLLIRQAIPGFQPLLSRDALFSLAARNDVEARLITHFKSKWALAHGPFQELPPIAKKEWTLLVQGVNLHDEAADMLLRQFRFIPDARLDDLMISYASDQGGVGAHFDSYDVFLLQAHGKRHWRIGAQKDLRLVPDMPLKILSHFKPEQEFTLEPGDMLYLPPHYAHDGIAQGECMTYSIGFRAPSYQEMGEAFLQFLAESIELPGRYADPDLRPSRHPAKIDTSMLTEIGSKLLNIKPSKEDLAIFLGEYLSEPKPSVFFTPSAKPMSFERFKQSAAKRGIKLSPKTRMLYHQKNVFINGESFRVDKADLAVLADLADLREIDGMHIKDASEDALEALFHWYEYDWLQLR